MVAPWFDDRVNLAIFMGEVSVRKKRYDTRLHSKTSCGLSQCTRRTGALRQGSLQTGPRPHLRAYNSWIEAAQGYQVHSLNAYDANPVWNDPKRIVFRDLAKRSLTDAGFRLRRGEGSSGDC